MPTNRGKETRTTPTYAHRKKKKKKGKHTLYHTRPCIIALYFNFIIFEMYVHKKKKKLIYFVRETKRSGLVFFARERERASERERGREREGRREKGNERKRERKRMRAREKIKKKKIHKKLSNVCEHVFNKPIVVIITYVLMRTTS